MHLFERGTCACCVMSLPFAFAFASAGSHLILFAGKHWLVLYWFPVCFCGLWRTRALPVHQSLSTSKKTNNATGGFRVEVAPTYPPTCQRAHWIQIFTLHKIGDHSPLDAPHPSGPGGGRGPLDAPGPLHTPHQMCPQTPGSSPWMPQAPWTPPTGRTPSPRLLPLGAPPQPSGSMRGSLD